MLESVRVAVEAKTTDNTLANRGCEGMLTEILTSVDMRYVNLNTEEINTSNSIPQSDTRMGKATRVNNRTKKAIIRALSDFVDKCPLVI